MYSQEDGLSVQCKVQTGQNSRDKGTAGSFAPEGRQVAPSHIGIGPRSSHQKGLAHPIVP